MASVIGVVQHWLEGTVNLRPGHPPVSGREALTQLLMFVSLGAAFLVFGALQLRRARKLHNNLQDGEGIRERQGLPL